MKKFYNFLAIVFLSILSHNVHSQSPGDIAFTAINVDGDEDFAFVLLTNLSNGTEIYFTENNWTGSAFSGTGEGQIKWTAGSDAYAGTIVVVNNINTGSPTVSSGTLSNKAGSWGLSSSNEGLYALSAAPATSYGSAPTFYASIHTDFSGSETISGTGLVSGTSSIDFDNDTDGVFFYRNEEWPDFHVGLQDSD
jgi:hypothetical protein